jgi:uncharacterized protein (TIGR03435 family)
MRRCVSGICVLAGLVAAAGAVGPEFEVASVKPARSGPRRMAGGPGTNSPGQFSCAGVNLKPLLLRAYDLTSYQLEGPPSIDSDRFDIDAKIPPGTTKEQFNLMLQNLLVERFGLAVHRETRELPIYELVVAKGGLKLKEAEKAPADAQTPPEPSADGPPPNLHMTRNKDGLPEFPPGVAGMFAMPVNGVAWVTARMQTIANLLSMLQFEIGRPVVDKTGATGIYDFNLRYAHDSAGAGGAGSAASAQPSFGALSAASDPAPDLLSAFVGQLGLKLEPKKGPLEILVVDHVNRTPTEN